MVRLAVHRRRAAGRRSARSASPSSRRRRVARARREDLDPVVDPGVELRRARPSRSRSRAPCAHAASRSSPLSSSSRAAVSPSTSGRNSVPALLITSPMRISGVSRRTRSVHRRRSQLAANSSAPPTHTPSTAAIAGTGAASTTRVMSLEALDRRRPRRRVGLDRGLEVVARGEVLAGAAQHDAAHLRRRSPASSTASAIARHGLEVPRVPALLAVPARPRVRPRGRRWSRSSCDLPSERLDGLGQRVAACRSVDDPGLVLGHGQRPGLEPRDRRSERAACPRARRSRRRAPRRRRLDVDPQRRRRSGRPRRPRSDRPSAGSLSRIAPIACGYTFTACTRSMSSRRPSMRMRGVVRPHAHRDVHTRPRSRGPVAQQGRGLAPQMRPDELAARRRPRAAAGRRSPDRPPRARRGRPRSGAPPRPRSHAPPIVDQTSLIPKVSATVGAPRLLDLGADREARAGLARRHDVVEALFYEGKVKKPNVRGFINKTFVSNGMGLLIALPLGDVVPSFSSIFSKSLDNPMISMELE